MRSLSRCAQRRHRLLGSEQRVIRRGELGHGCPPRLLGCRSIGHRGIDLARRILVGAGEHVLCLGQLGRLPLERGDQLGEARASRLEPALDANHGLSRRLADARRLTCCLVGVPVALLCRGNRLSPGRLCLAEPCEAGLCRGRRSSRVAQRGSRRDFPALMRSDDEPARPGAERVVLLLVLGLQARAAEPAASARR